MIAGNGDRSLRYLDFSNFFTSSYAKSIFRKTQIEKVTPTAGCNEQSLNNKGET